MLSSRWDAVTAARTRELQDAMGTLRPGEPPELARRLIERRIPRVVALGARRWSPSARQCDVLARRAKADGTANKVIAAMLGVSERTVEGRVTARLSKAQVESCAELIAKLWKMD